MSKPYQLTVSIVLYNTDQKEIMEILKTLAQSDLKTMVYLIDNSSQPMEAKVFSGYGNVEYIITGQNLGFGSGHNIAIKKATEISECHLVLNADVKFDSSILQCIYEYIMADEGIGLVAPKIYNPDGSIQYSVKLLPSPANLIVRRFVPLRWLQERMNKRYEFRFFKFNRIIEVPYVMGCFMFIKCKVFKKVEGFDERFFMYPEDIDLTRRIHEHYKTVYYPEVSIVHEHGKGSYKNYLLLYYHISSMIKYFNKWGWFDRDRQRINAKIMAQFQ